MALDTVADYVSLARTLLQDEVETYRYSDASLVTGLNLAFMETKRVRADLMIGKTLPNFVPSNLTDAVDMDEMYRVPLVYYMCGHAQMRDEEGNQDQRAAGFLQLFRSQMGAP